MSIILEKMGFTIVKGYYISVNNGKDCNHTLCMLAGNDQVCINEHGLSGYDEDTDSVYFYPTHSIKHIRIYALEEEIEGSS